jgi:HEAT repeat protein
MIRPNIRLTAFLLLSCAVLVTVVTGSRAANSTAHAVSMHSAGSGKPGDETITNFKKYFRTYKETAVRVEAILTLEGIEDVAIVDTLVPILKDPDGEVVRNSVRVLSGFKTRPPIDALLAVLKGDKTEAVRTGILRAIAEGKYTDTAQFVATCLTDKAWDVRRRALEALAASNDPAMAPQIAPLCDDAEVAVRCVALDSLTRLKSDLVVPKAISSLNHAVWQVHVSAINALTKVRSKDAIEPLITRLGVEEGRLVPDIAEALANLTGKELGADAEKWKAWWAENKATFVLPTAEAIAYLRGHRDAATGGARSNFPKSGVTDYHNIPTASRSIMFVIDVSGSMEAEVVEKERFSDGNYPSFQRIDIVKTELSRTIDRLEPFVNFNILAFATKVDPWKQKLVQANVLNKSAAKDWVKGLIAIGGASKEDLATVGFTGSAGLEMGKTNTFGALMQALNVKTGPKTGGLGAAENKDYTVDVDTIFFLSDGRPTVGEFNDPDDILREVKAANELRKVVIHTIAIGEFQKDFMRKIAEQNGGVFVDLGK